MLGNLTSTMDVQQVFRITFNILITEEYYVGCDIVVYNFYQGFVSERIRACNMKSRFLNS